MKEGVDLLLKGGTVITIDPRRSIVSDGTVAVKGDRIVDVCREDELSAKYQTARVLDTHGKIIMPGMVDTHNHIAQSFVKALVYEDLGWSRIYRNQLTLRPASATSFSASLAVSLNALASSMVVMVPSLMTILPLTTTVLTSDVWE